MLKYIKMETILKDINFVALSFYAFMSPFMLSFKVQEIFKSASISFL